MPKPDPAEWRAFEKAVARIETTLAPCGARVFCPDRHVRDVDTGAFREVDATIRFPDGEHERFIALECRRRGRRETVQWIEELAGRKGSIRAERVIGISRSGFAKNAVKKAAARGIELRTAQEVQALDLLGWIAFQSVRLSNHRWGVVEVSVYCCDPDPAIQLQPVVTQSDANSDPLDRPSFHIDEVQLPVSLRQLVVASCPTDGWPWPSPGQVSMHTITLCCDGKVQVATNRGMQRVNEIRVVCHLEHVQTEGSLVGAFKYSDPRGPVLDAAHFDISAILPGGVVGLHRVSNSGRIGVHVFPTLRQSSPSHSET